MVTVKDDGIVKIQFKELSQTNINKRGAANTRQFNNLILAWSRKLHMKLYNYK